MNRYPLYELSEDDFERLCVLICKKILGEGTTPFTKGRDGGRDGKFIGIANKFPSESEPWKGTTIIQAKHTSKIDASYSDSDFKSLLSSNIIPAIKKLKQDGLDHYLLFSNRNLTGETNEKITKEIFNETSVHAYLCGNENLHCLLSENREIISEMQLNSLLTSFDFDTEDIRNVILSIGTYFCNNQAKKNDDFDYPGIDRKNKLNNLQQDYYDASILQSMPEFLSIKTFLEDPINEETKQIYYNAASDLNAKIAKDRGIFTSFDEAIETAYDNIIHCSTEAGVLKNKRLVRIMLHYMYCNCDLGKKE